MCVLFSLSLSLHKCYARSQTQETNDDVKVVKKDTKCTRRALDKKTPRLHYCAPPGKQFVYFPFSSGIPRPHPPKTEGERRSSQRSQEETKFPKVLFLLLYLINSILYPQQYSGLYTRF